MPLGELALYIHPPRGQISPSTEYSLWGKVSRSDPSERSHRAAKTQVGSICLHQMHTSNQFERKVWKMLPNKTKILTCVFEFSNLPPKTWLQIWPLEGSIGQVIPHWPFFFRGDFQLMRGGCVVVSSALHKREKEEFHSAFINQASTPFKILCLCL